MKLWLLLLCSGLCGCVLVLPNTTPPEPTPVVRPVTSSCAEFIPPARHPLPKDLVIDDKVGGEYVELLQDLTTGLAQSLIEYKNYIRAEHQDLDHAYAQYQESCRGR